jgi:3'-phosphoadenosine 5'-phosphosulfate (PAPS) 3'-phosphatase
VLEAAGGRVLALDGQPLRYAKPDFFNPGFVAVGDFDAPPLGPYMSATSDTAPN